MGLGGQRTLAAVPDVTRVGQLWGSDTTLAGAASAVRTIRVDAVERTRFLV